MPSEYDKINDIIDDSHNVDFHTNWNFVCKA